MLAVDAVAMQIMHLMKAVHIYATCSAHKKYINFTRSMLRAIEIKVIQLQSQYAPLQTNDIHKCIMLSEILMWKLMTQAAGN
jgi:hypothetical protein